MDRDQKESLLGEVSPSSHPRRSTVRGMERVSRARLGKGTDKSYRDSETSSHLSPAAAINESQMAPV